ncbi:MAG: glycoside hydrolase family 97 protein [Clostridiales bacterium]|nr:glycoside hydrolase family 97 protein [Clostridiales bacterium]
MLKACVRRMFELGSQLKGLTAGVTQKSAEKTGTLKATRFEEDAAKVFFIKSPNGLLTANLHGGELTYNVYYNGERIISDSLMGLRVKKNVNLGSNVIIGIPKVESHYEEYRDRGPDNKSVDNHTKFTFPVKHLPTGLEYLLEIKAWDDGFGFRFVFEKNTRLLVNEEVTDFRLPLDSVCWYQTDPQKLQGKTLEQKSRYLPNNVDFACLTTFQLAENKGYVIITEADLRDYPGASLLSKGRGVLKINFWDSGKFYVKGCVTPWRLVIACRTLNELVNCDVIKNAAEPEHEIFKDADWIKPGKCIWSFFVEKDEDSRSFDTIMKFNKYTQELGYDYNLIDSGWRKWALTESAAFRKVKRIVEDAEKRGVGIWVWKAAPKGPYFGIYRKWFFAKCRKIGVKGVKLDHIESESKFQINLYRKFLEEAAKNKLMVLYHNPQKQTGLSRTYPILLNMEAIRGLQCGCDEDDSTILPFTRLVAGDADYTPLCWTVKKRRREASIGHLMGTCIVITSSFLTISEHPDNIIKHIMADFIRELPTTWDKTVCLPSSVFGEVAIFARQKGEIWYLGAVNSRKGEREIEIDFSFLPDSCEYNLELFADDFTPERDVKLCKYSVSSGDKISIKTDNGGGFAGRLTKAE